MNLLQISCMITWAQKNSACNLEKMRPFLFFVSTLSTVFCQLDIVTHIFQMAEKRKGLGNRMGLVFFSSLINSIFGILSAKDAKIQFRFVRMPIYCFHHLHMILQIMMSQSSMYYRQ